jgi:hypothetical protein
MTEISEQRRLTSFIKSLGRPLLNAVGLSRSVLVKGPPGLGRKTGSTDPYWLQLSRWLAKRYSERDKGDGRLFIKDTLWAQYCLFLFIRIQDDILDRQNKNPSEIFLSDQFLFEAERVLHLHFPHSKAFWDMYRCCLETTTRSILKLDVAQKSVDTDPTMFLPLYAGVDSVFKIAPYAVCLHYNRLRGFGHVQEFLRGVALACQILDDLSDIGEDLRRGRYNYAARILLGAEHVRHKSAHYLLDRAAHKLYFSPEGDKILAEAEKHFAEALAALEALKMPHARGFYRSYRAQITSARQHLHARGTKLLFT